MKSKCKKLLTLLVAAMMLLSGCVQEEPPSTEDNPAAVKEPLVLTIAAGEAQNTLEAALNTTAGGETILYHLYENLLRWEDDGNGYATLAPGQAKSYTEETDYAGNKTYTFVLRDDIFWSDGQPVTSYQFAAAWQRIADPAYGSLYRELLACVAGYDEVQTTGDSSLLEVTTPDSHTLVVRLNGSYPYFLETVCAGAHTMPVRTYLPGNSKNQIVTNGAYIVSEFSGEIVKLTKSEHYYDAANVVAEELRFIPATGSESDYEKLLNGQLDFAVELPDTALTELAENKFWTPEAVTTTCGVLINTLQPPFDNADVRLAFRLAINEQALTEALGDLTVRPAIGLIPYGVSDYTAHVEETAEQSEEDSDPNAVKPKVELKVATYWDFRQHGEEIVTLDVTNDYEADCTRARTLLAGAGYLGGSGFPTVEYVYVDTPENRVIALQLRSAWAEVLGVTVTLSPLTAEEYALMLAPSVDEESGEEIAIPAFRLAAAEFSAVYNTAEELLNEWRSENTDNCTGYSSAAFDILMRAADDAVASASYDAYLHDAEAILLEEAPVIPLFYRGTTYTLDEELTGLYCAPNGVYFFFGVTEKE